MTAVLHRALLQAWARRGPLASVLWPVSMVFAALAWTRRRLYKTTYLRPAHLRAPVVVVGNVVAGGAGKTPVVMALVTHLTKRGWKPGVVSRGYGRRSGICQEVCTTSRVADVGDEPLLIKRKTGVPVFVAASRRTAAQQLLARHPDVDVLVSDDGLQHLALHRDIELCVFDERGIGNGWLLPAGPLREPWPRPCDFILDAGTMDGPQRFQVQRRLAAHAMRVNGEMVPLETLGRDNQNVPPLVWAVAGIARPEQFFDMLRRNGIALSGTTPLPDHGTVAAHDLHAARDHLLLCTEKDADKVRLLRPDAVTVGLELAIDPAFWDAFDRLLIARAAR